MRQSPEEATGFLVGKICTWYHVFAARAYPKVKDRMLEARPSTVAQTDAICKLLPQLMSTPWTQLLAVTQICSLQQTRRQSDAPWPNSSEKQIEQLRGQPQLLQVTVGGDVQMCACDIANKANTETNRCDQRNPNRSIKYIDYNVMIDSCNFHFMHIPQSNTCTSLYLIKLLQTFMFSQAGKQYDRAKKIKPHKAPLIRKPRHGSVFVKKHDNPKFSPFATISRSARDSYLLRVTHEPVTQTNYYSKFQSILHQHRRPTIDKAKFQRIIGDVRGQKYDFSVGQPSDRKQCMKSISPSAKRPLTVRELQHWRKTLEHFDFAKQPQLTRSTRPDNKLSLEQSTNLDFMTTLNTITESNFNNFNRFNFIDPKKSKAHPFQSDKGHQYLKQIQDRDRSPEYDLNKADQSIIKKAMSKTRGEKRFSLYRDKIATRQDRSDPYWHTSLIYQPTSTHSIKETPAFSIQTDRQPNQIHSKYPIRLSLTRPQSISYQ